MLLCTEDEVQRHAIEHVPGARPCERRQLRALGNSRHAEPQMRLRQVCGRARATGRLQARRTGHDRSAFTFQQVILGGPLAGKRPLVSPSFFISFVCVKQRAASTCPAHRARRARQRPQPSLPLPPVSVGTAASPCSISCPLMCPPPLLHGRACLSPLAEVETNLRPPVSVGAAAAPCSICCPLTCPPLTTHGPRAEVETNLRPTVSIGAAAEPCSISCPPPLPHGPRAEAETLHRRCPDAPPWTQDSS